MIVLNDNCCSCDLGVRGTDLECGGRGIKSRFDNWLLNKRGTRARAKHFLDRCQNEQNIAHQTQEQKKCFKLFDRMFDGLQMLSNTIKQHQIRT